MEPRYKEVEENKIPLLQGNFAIPNYLYCFDFYPDITR